MKQISPIFKREFLGYFRSPVAYVFLIAFLVISVSLAFSPFGAFFKAGVASLERYFMFFPWLFLFLVPAVGMRLWSEEKRAGTVELLFTLPVTTLEAVAGKFLAAWAFLAIAILLVGGKPLMTLLFGKAFLGAYEPLVVMMIIPFLGIFSFPLAPMLYALGRSDGPLKAKLLGSALFFITIAPLSWRWDVMGAAVALVLANVANTGAMLLQLRGEHRRVRPRSA